MTTHDVYAQDALRGLPAAGEVLDGKYRIVGLIGVGGMGAVMEGVHVALDERIAVKFLLPALHENEEALERFEREARAAVRIKSEHVAKIFDVSSGVGQRPYIVMEFLEGDDLAAALTHRHRFEVRDAVGQLLQGCEAVAEAHALGIVHRDLKPENLFVTRRRDGSTCIKVLDFGLSKVVRLVTSQGTRPRALTMDDKTLGTPNYMSPEQWMSAKDVGPPTDQWALAAILYELLAGQPAFGGKHVGEVCSKILNFDPPPLRSLRPDVPEPLAAAVHRALAKNPDERFPTLAELADAIGSFGPPLAALSVQRIAGVLGRAPTATGSTILGLGVERERLDSAELEKADTLVSHDRPVQAVDRWGSTPSWQKAAGPMAEANRRKRRNALVALGVGAGALVTIVVVALVAGQTPTASQDAAVGGDVAGSSASNELGPASTPSDPEASASEQEGADAGQSDDDVPDAAAGGTAADPTASPAPKRRPTTKPPRPRSTSIFDQRW